MGAAIGTLAAELAACLLQVRCAQAEFSVARDLFRCLPYMGIGAVIFAVVRGTAMFLAGQPVIAVLLAETGLWRSCRLRTDSRLLEADRKSSG